MMVLLLTFCFQLFDIALVSIELIDTSDMVQLLQITLDLLDIHSFWYSIQENLERAPKSWNGFGQNKEGNSKRQERIQDIPVSKSEDNGHQDDGQPTQGIFQKMQAENGFILGLPLANDQTRQHIDTDSNNSQPKKPFVIDG